MKPNSFLNRHLGPREYQVEEMLQVTGASSMEDLINKVVPENIKLEKELEFSSGITEQEYLAHIEELGKKNKVFKSYIGLGYNPTALPSVIKRNILENPGWYTAYTPYQPEIAQGRLEALINFQTMVVDLTGMEIANASLLDEGTAAAEAVALLYDARSRAKKKEGVCKVFVSEEVFEQTLSVFDNRLLPIGVEIVVGNYKEFDFSKDYFAVVLQYPGKYGIVEDYHSFIKKAKDADLSVAVIADILSLVSLKSPGEMGADVVAGSTQRFGVPMGYGGPHAAYLATKEIYKRSVPGRIIGVTKDVDGNIAYRMALQTREQHIKRERATSNICTAQALLAIMAGMYAVYHGKEGLEYIAHKVHTAAVATSETLKKNGINQKNNFYFDTIQVEVSSDKLKPLAEAKQINFFYIDNNTVSISFSEVYCSEKDVQEVINLILEAFGKEKIQVSLEDFEQTCFIPDSLKRTSDFLKDPIFNRYRSETDMMRYIKKLERKDLSLNHSMISLGSCTMKLNPATTMLPLSTSNWANIHPFAPLDQTIGYQEMLSQLEHDLNIVTGFAGTSLQPNSGAQGEYAGLCVIQKYHESRGEGHRNIVLIPTSAHGTNPASAAIAGLKIVLVKTTEKGDVDIEDLKEKAQKHKDHLASLMVTYPSTHGVYEVSIKEITQIIHDNGGQVYMDGANMNAQVGLTNPANIGADVCHLNLHKTFSIPHGGGGPGVGPICVAAHLKEFLPSNPLVKKVGGKDPIASVSSAPWGSALVCLIPYAYIKMLGKEGLVQATKIAILNANYMKALLEKEFDILYKGDSGMVAHEMILDTRPFKDNKGVSVTDIAKRLMDYGFHAPTVSFPVGGTLMIEPTESESKEELDRFVKALLSIKKEIEEIQDTENNLLVNAPHTMQMIAYDKWDYPYTREQAVFPTGIESQNKFWPSVRRVNEAFGDLNFFCTCPPLDIYQEE